VLGQQANIGKFMYKKVPPCYAGATCFVMRFHLDILDGKRTIVVPVTLYAGTMNPEEKADWTLFGHSSAGN
jgi:hypothetical protein